MAKTEQVIFRLEPEVYKNLVRRAKAAGQSPNGFARELFEQRLAALEANKTGIVEIYTDLQKLRSELAVATEAILTLNGREAISPEKAADWVRKNLNR